MFPAALNHHLSQRHPEWSSSYNHICGGPRHEHRPPENHPEEPVQNGSKWQGEGRRRGSDWFAGVKQRDGASWRCLSLINQHLSATEGGTGSRRLGRRREMDHGSYPIMHLFVFVVHLKMFSGEQCYQKYWDFIFKPACSWSSCNLIITTQIVQGKSNWAIFQFFSTFYKNTWFYSRRQ